MYDLITRREALRRVGLLVGGALSASTVSAILGGCRADGPASGYAFQALDADQQELTATLVDLIIPETDTPGARAAGAHTFIDKLLADWMDDDERNRFLAGLADVDARARADHGARFVDLDAAQQTAFLTVLDRDAYAPEPEAPAPADSTVAPDSVGRAETAEAAAERAQSGTDAMQDAQEETVGQPADPGSGDPGGDPNARPPAPAKPAAPPFFRTLKELALAGYYTSEIGATQELQWLAAPGRYDADVPLSDVGRAWA
jgi:hypothetical protein